MSTIVGVATRMTFEDEYILFATLKDSFNSLSGIYRVSCTSNDDSQSSLKSIISLLCKKPASNHALAPASMGGIEAMMHDGLY